MRHEPEEKASHGSHQGTSAGHALWRKGLTRQHALAQTRTCTQLSKRRGSISNGIVGAAGEGSGLTGTRTGGDKRPNALAWSPSFAPKRDRERKPILMLAKRLPTPSAPSPHRPLPARAPPGNPDHPRPAPPTPKDHRALPAQVGRWYADHNGRGILTWPGPARGGRPESTRLGLSTVRCESPLPETARTGAVG